MITEEVLKDIFKPRNLKWRTSITKVEPNRLTTRGHLQEDLIGNISFCEMIHLLIKGKLPSKNESKMLGAILVSFCDHGVTPPGTQAARIMASTGSPLHACIAGGLLSFGKNHAGAIEYAMKILQEGIRGAEDNINEIAEEIVNHFLKNKEKIFGFGHRFHDEDPRAPKLMELARKYNCFNRHSELALAIESYFLKRKASE